MNELNIKVIKRIEVFVPLVLWKVLRKLGFIQDRKNVFEGVFEHIEQVEAPEYDSDESLNESYKFTKDKFATYLSKGKLPESTPLTPIANLLPLLIAILGQSRRTISILDYGGGMGASYVDCLHSLSNADIELEYHIVDLSRTIKFGKKIFTSDLNIHFHSNIPLDTQKIDVVVLGSSLEYISDYKSLIHCLMELSPKYVFMTDNFMGKMPTFATTQVNMKNRRIGYWIFQLDEIIELITQYNFSLIYRSVNYQPFHHFENFPDRYRVKNTCNLLFSRNICGESGL